MRPDAPLCATGRGAQFGGVVCHKLYKTGYDVYSAQHHLRVPISL